MLLSYVTGIGVFLIFDKIYFKSIDFVEELKKGNIAIAIVIGSYLVGLGILLAFIFS